MNNNTAAQTLKGTVVENTQGQAWILLDDPISDLGDVWLTGATEERLRWHINDAEGTVSMYVIAPHIDLGYN